MVPISLLAGPVSQFFQPKLLRVIGEGNHELAQNTLRKFVLVTLAITAIPTIFFWVGRESLITLWLGPGTNNREVIDYVAILLPGVMGGALGFIPYSLLLSAKDYRFQAIMSSAMTVATLIATGIAASCGSITAICWIYVTYHCGSTLASWTRSVCVSSTASLGKQSLFVVLKLAAFAMLAALLVNALAK
jgi:O-antigen/teichoic acid export membrane protein